MPSFVQPYKILLTFFAQSLLNGDPWFDHSKFSYTWLWQYSGDSSRWSRFQGPKRDLRDCSQQTILQCPGKYCFLKVVLGNIPLKHTIKQMWPRVFMYFSLWHSEPSSLWPPTSSSMGNWGSSNPSIEIHVSLCLRSTVEPFCSTT